MDQLKGIEFIMTIEKESLETDSYEKILSLLSKWKLITSIESITTEMVKNHFNKLIQLRIPIIYKQLLHKAMINVNKWEKMDKEEIITYLEETLNSPGSEVRAIIEREVRAMKLDLSINDRVLQWNELKIGLSRLNKVSKGGLTDKEYLHYIATAMGNKEFVELVNPMIGMLPDEEKELTYKRLSKAIDKIVAS